MPDGPRKENDKSPEYENIQNTNRSNKERLMNAHVATHLQFFNFYFYQGVQYLFLFGFVLFGFRFSYEIIQSNQNSSSVSLGFYFNLVFLRFGFWFIGFVTFLEIAKIINVYLVIGMNKVVYVANLSVIVGVDFDEVIVGVAGMYISNYNVK